MGKAIPAVERKISRLTREIEKIDAFFYQTKAGDRDLYAGMLERKRDDMVRSAVLQLHTVIEDLLNIRIMNRILGMRSVRTTRSGSARALHKLFVGARSIGFEMKLNLAIAIGLINSKMQERLTELNRLRNRCSHNWRLNVRVRRGKKPKQKKPPLLLYRGRDLHHVAVLEEFSREYTRLYLKLYMKD
jgi:hypothetical protein